MKSDIYLSFVVILQLLCVTFQLLLPLMGLAAEEDAARYRVYITALTYLPAALIAIKRRPNVLLFSFLLYFAVAIIHYVLYPASHVFLESSQAITLTPISILTIVYILSIRDIDLFKKVLLYFSRAYMVLAVLYTYAFFFLPFRLTDTTYSMAFGYASLLPCLFLYVQKNVLDLVLSLILAVIILFAGSRGPLVPIIIFYVIHYFLLPSKERKKFSFFFAVFAAVIVYYVVAKVDLEASRTITIFETSGFAEHNTRDAIYEKAQKFIMMRPITGWGIGADRSLIETFCHNIFLELSLHYGIVVTTFLSIAFFYYVIRNFFLKRLLKLNGGREFYIMFILFGFLPMLVSGSYLINYNFSFMMGYLLRYSIKHKINKIINS